MKKVRVRLLNDGGYLGFKGVQFPVEVEGSLYSETLVEVLGDELFRITEGYVDDDLAFEIGSECEII